MSDPKGSSRSKVKAAAQGGTAANRRAHNKTDADAGAYGVYSGASPAYEDPIHPSDLLDPDSTGAAEVPDGFFQATAMLDKAELLGELADLQQVPNTRADVEAEQAAPKGLRLIIVAGPDLGLEWAFKKPEVVIGRDEDCELHIPDIAVSRRHAKISLEDNVFVLTDFGSGNGTFLNGVRISQEVLASGDEIVIGERTLRFVELNEAPPTGAAHPIQERIPEPKLGDPGKAVGSAVKAPVVGRASQVDVGVLAKGDAGPKASLDAVVDPAELPPADKTPKPGATLKKVVALVVVGVLVVGGAIGGYLYWRHVQAEKAEAARLARAKREFLQGIELVKALRFGDAVVLFDRVLAVHPDHGRASEYKAHAQKELGVWGELEAARRLATEGRLAQAIDKLDAIPAEDTGYAQLISERRAAYGKAIAEALLKDARAKLDAGDLDAALELAMKALEASPSLASAQSLRDDIEDAKRERDKPRPKKEEIPADVARAVALYKNEQIGAAIDAAEAASGPSSATWVARMKRVKGLLAEAETAHKRKAAAELLRVAPSLLDVDRQIALGEGKIRAKVQRYYADALYLKGIEAYAEKDFVKAYQLLSDALRQQPGHELSQTRLAELSRKARDLYYEGYVLKDTNAAETKKIFKRLVQMTKPDNQYHQLAQKWLKANGG
ncbi:FHA domain-containing protein [Myxococcota bacterium]|nr:FHA domain-containing protein [Myxococcota bacterium]